MRVDSHVHLWDQQHTPQPWMTAEHAALGPGDIEPLLQRNDIDSVILIWGLTSQALAGAAPDQGEELLGGNGCRVYRSAPPLGAS